jgi:hypothetical protein
MSDDSGMKNRGGRPRLVRDESSIVVSARFPEQAYNQLRSLANKHRGQSVSSMVRSIVVMRLRVGDE